ncbi:MAG: ABC transporter ATP-binding protein [Limnochordales bacterium]|nr:ABC transporter ATP-binding protein [Limnochordales bacterium]
MQIVLDNIAKLYGDIPAVHGVSLVARSGELLTLLGPSGCGKTTLLRIIAGLEKPSAGRVLFDGEDVTAWPPETRGVGLVFQNYALFPHMSVAENIAYGLKQARRPRASRHEIRKRVDELLELLDLGGLAERMPAQLSAGQQQRVAIARALAPRPHVLLLDEPLSALDARLREHLRLQIRRLQQRLGITMIYVTHDQAEALSISDRIAVMRAGRIEQIGTPEEIYERPASRFVAEFVGDANFFAGDRPGELLLVRPEHIEVLEVLEILPPDPTAEVSVCTAVFPEEPALPPLSQLVRGELLATLQSSEYLATHRRLHLRWRDSVLRVVAPTSCRIAPGQRVRLGASASRAIPIPLADR